MPCCPSCGKECGPDKNFCGNCGTALHKDRSPGVSVIGTPKGHRSPFPIPWKLSTSTRLPVSSVILIIAGFIVTGTVAYFFLGAVSHDLEAGIPNSSGITPVVTTPDIKTPSFSAVDPGVSLSVAETMNMSTTSDTSLQREERFGETYLLVYEANRQFLFGQKTDFEYKLANPPLFIKFNVSPVMIAREKVVDIGLSSEHSTLASYPDPRSWFLIEVINTVSGNVVDRQGFNREFSEMTLQEFMVRAPGSYRIEMSGHNVDADVRILTGRP